MVCSLKSLRVLKWGNVDLSCVAGKLTMNDSRWQNFLILTNNFMQNCPLETTQIAPVTDATRRFTATPRTPTCNSAFPVDECLCH